MDQIPSYKPLKIIAIYHFKSASRVAIGKREWHFCLPLPLKFIGIELPVLFFQVIYFHLLERAPFQIFIKAQ